MRAGGDGVSLTRSTGDPPASAPVGVPPAVCDQPDTPPTTVPAGGPPALPVKARGLRRWLYIGLGLVCLLFAAAGAVLPVLPCTPWVLAASYCFARSSDWLHRRLRRTPYFGHILRDWDEHRGIRPWVKVTAISCVTLFMTLMAIFSRISWWAKGPAIGLAAVGVCVILFVVPTVRAKRPLPIPEPSP